MSVHGPLLCCGAWQAPPWILGPLLLAHLAAGAGLGVVYFRGLRWNARLFVQGGALNGSLALMAGRVLLLVGLLTLAALEGAAPLLAMALGVFIGRFAVMRRTRSGAP
jgi:N-ATPase, AtpR subunit